MFDTLIVGLDGRDAGRDALELARRLASPRAQITLAYVQVVAFKPDPEAGSFSLAAERRPVLERIATLRDEAGLDARVLWVEARTVHEGLHRLAVTEGADLLVVGASHLDAYDQTFFGAETKAVLADAPCPVAVAPLGYAAGSPHLQRIGAAYDASPEGERALAVARELAGEHGAALSAFQAVREPVGVRDPLYPEREADERVAQARRRLAGLGDVDAHAASGEAVDELARYGASVDLLVVGSHRYGPIDRLVSGTTAQRLAERAPCPLLVLAPER
jgi:nucleotide-binding universal stress UspA family protein